MYRRRQLLRLLALASGIGLASRPVAAHAGTTHAGTPHWLLFLLFAGGIGTIVGGTAAGRRDLASSRLAAGAIAAGAVAAVFGGIGLVEIQVVGRAPPRIVDLYPLLSVLIGGLLAVAGPAAVRLKWPTRPRYAFLCLNLAAWIGYPGIMSNNEYYSLLGYLIALSLPAVLAYIVWTDARPVLQSLRLQRRPKLAGIGAGLLMSVFFAFSAGTMTFNPDQGVNKPTEAFVIPYMIASPLVVWPGVEWYFPSIPFAGYLSVGTLLVMGILGGLVGLNVAVVTQQWTGSGSIAGKQLLSGSLVASGATACCCCAPAFYGVLSVLFGSAVTPIYWSFMIPSSPVGGAFFAASVLLLLGSLLRSSGSSVTNADASGAASPPS